MPPKANVLIVDDDDDVRLLCRVNLEFEGYRVREAVDGQAALDAVAAERPDVVLLDVMLPEVDGWTVLATLKDDPATHDLPVVMLTARSLEEDQRKGWSTGAAEYITKPFSPLVLSQVLEDVLATDPEEQEERRRLILQRMRLLSDPPR